MDERDDPRPLVAGTVRWSDEAIEVLVGLDRVLIEGDLELTRRVLGDCDGATPLAELVRRHGAAAAEVVEELRAAGAIVDGGQAWRVLHRQSAVGTILGRPIDADEVLALGRATFRPTGIDGDNGGVALAPIDGATLALTGARRSAVADGPRVRTTFAALGTVLAATYRVDLRQASVPSAGGLYPLVVHVLLREPLAPLQRGLWWLDPVASTLHRVSEPVPAAGLFIEEPTCAQLLARDEPIVFLSADLTRPTRKYGARGYRYALIEAGAAAQSAYLAATEIELPLRAIGGIDDGATHAYLRLPDDAVCLLALTLGQ